MKHFKLSILLTVIAIAGMGFWGYQNGGVNMALETIFITLLLIFLEISFSFDNAVVNASILKSWNKFWKILFLTIGMIIAVFGMRLLFPLIIVAQTADLSIIDVWKVAIYAPYEYSNILNMHHAEISAFGSMFLLLVFLNFIYLMMRKKFTIGFKGRKNYFRLILGKIQEQFQKFIRSLFHSLIIPLGKVPLIWIGGNQKFWE